MIQIRMQQGLSQDARIIRQEVFVEEQGFHHEFDETDQTAWHLVLYENGHAAGCCRLFTSDNPDVYILGRLAVRKSCRTGSGRMAARPSCETAGSVGTGPGAPVL